MLMDIGISFDMATLSVTRGNVIWLDTSTKTLKLIKALFIPYGLTLVSMLLLISPR